MGRRGKEVLPCGTRDASSSVTRKMCLARNSGPHTIKKPMEFHRNVHKLSDVGSKMFKFASHALISLPSFTVFAFLDILDVLLCGVYKIVDYLLLGECLPCYCYSTSPEIREDISETLYSRKNFAREALLTSLSWIKFMSNLFAKEKYKGSAASVGKCRRSEAAGLRWSDCGCGSCISWTSTHKEKLYVRLGGQGHDTEVFSCSSHCSDSNVIFIHGFLSSSSFWAETVYNALTGPTKSSYRLFAVDLLGFGKSPKPSDCLYTVADHIDMIERSVLRPYQLDSFHLVAHSMGSIIAVALAAKYPRALKSLTLLSPPYFAASTKGQTSQFVLNKVAPRTLWPFISFGSSIMSWYEHVGRTVCLVVCKNHRAWEWIVKRFTGNRRVNHQLKDFTRHTHHSAWHTFHNVICGSASKMDSYLKIIEETESKVTVFHGKKDGLIPTDCSLGIKSIVGRAEVKVLDNADHNTVIVGREKAFARELEEIWSSCR